MKLDSKDYQILWELDNNSRQHFSELAKKVRLTKEAVFYRLKNLENRKIINGFSSFISLAKLNLIQAKLLIKFQNIENQKKEEIISFCVASKKTNWVGLCHGTFDLMIGFVIRDLREFSYVKDKIVSRYNDYFYSVKSSIMLETYIYGRKYFLENKKQPIRNYIGTPESYAIDELDIKILNIIAGNTREKIIDIARKLRTTARVVSYKLKKLEKSGIIQKYSISVNHNQLGISFFKSFIQLRNPKKKKQIMEFLSLEASCLHVVESLAEWDLEPEFEVYSTKEFYDLQKRLKDKFGSDIKVIDTIMISDERKFVPFPEYNFN